MDSIGVQIKNARTRKGLSLLEVSAKTRIPVRLLESIEGDDPFSVDSAFYYRSFVRQFASCVGMDPFAIAAPLHAATEQIPEPPIPGQDVSRVRPDLPGLKPKRTHKARWVLSVGSLALMLGACSAFYEFWESSRPLPQTAPQRTQGTEAAGRRADLSSTLSKGQL
jgi:cytoskeletal protein RodZ